MSWCGVGVTVRLDLAEVRRSRWLWFCVSVYALLAGIFVLVGLRESTVFGFTGAGRVLTSFSHALLLLLPLLALAATGQVVNRARDDGTLELLLSQPIPRIEYFLGLTVVRLGVLLLPLCLLMLAVGLYGHLAFGQNVPWLFVVRSLAVSAGLLCAFCGIGLLISSSVRGTTRSMIYILLAWVASVALLDFALAGMMLRWRLEPRIVFALATANPVQAARMSLLSSADPQLAVLGPVGFYLANSIGARALFWIGVLWPALLGVSSWTVAAWRFCRRDAV